MTPTQPPAESVDKVKLDSVSVVADIPIQPLPGDSCAHVYMTHGNVDDMEVKAVLKSNGQPWDHTDADVGIPGIGVPAPPIAQLFPKQSQRECWRTRDDAGGCTGKSRC